MSNNGQAVLTKLATGIPGLDEVLGGGLPEYSFNLIAGEPGSGKTTLAHQLLFANATNERRVLYFTVLGEPAIKMLRYMQQMTFFDRSKVGDAIRFIDLSPEVISQNLNQVLDRIVQQVKEVEPAFVAVDSFRTIVRARSMPGVGEMELHAFLQRLALYLASWQATTFLVGEYLRSEIQDNPIFTIADSILWLSQITERSSVVRKLQVMKLRGQASAPGLHTFRIDSSGLHIFPRMLRRMPTCGPIQAAHRLTTGVRALDLLMGGGIPVGDTVLIAGPTGCGKTCLSTQFAGAAGEKEPAVLVGFEEHPLDYLLRAGEMGVDLDGLMRRGILKVISLRPLDLSVEETLLEIQSAVLGVGARRLVIDSLTGFEVALAPSFREDFRESLYRMLGSLCGVGVTIYLTVEVTESWTELRFSPHAVSFLAEDIILLRYVEIDGALKKVLTVAKMRRSVHDTKLYEFAITARGLVLGEPLTQYRGILTGVPKLRPAAARPAFPGLIEPERRVLQLLLQKREAAEAVIAAATGVAGPDLNQVLGRLIALNYAIKVVEKDQTLYRPTAFVLGR